jgi:hypothetical protein
MKVKLFVDLIKDRYGNYYIGIRDKIEGISEITLVNFILQRSFAISIRDALIDIYKEKKNNIEMEYLGAIPMKELKSKILSIEKGFDRISRIIPLEIVYEHYDVVKFVPFYEVKRV